MSLRPDDRGGRARSKSPGARERSRSRSDVRMAEAVPRTSYPYQPAAPMPPGSYRDNGVSSPSYEVRSSASSKGNSYFPTTTAPSRGSYQASSSVSMPAYPVEDAGGFTMGGYTDFPPKERPGYGPPHGHYPPPPGRPSLRDDDVDLAYGVDNSREKPSRTSSYTRPSPAQFQYAQAPKNVTYTSRPNASASQQQPVSHSTNPYGQPPHHSLSYSNAPQDQFHEQFPRMYSHNAYEPNAHIVDVTPGRERLEHHDSYSRSHRLSVGPNQPSTLSAPRSPGLGPRMDRLSVSGNRPDLSGIGAGMAPPSPLLEAYHGTYQSLSPMPLVIRPDDDLDDLSDLEPLSPVGSRTASKHNGHHLRESAERERKEKKRVKVYDAEEDAKAIASALNHHKPDADALCDVLPRLSHDQIIDVRKEYKKQVKVQGKGVNLSKHINMKLSGTNFGKAVYVTALGRWESEGYWANFWYQSHGSRRELLIESLMGRTNTEIRMIKEEFKDKRYSDSLTKCMEKELKMDKFRTAILMALEERRQEEQDSYPTEYVHRDVDTLYRSVRTEKGGESAMLDIIVRRSDAHLREVLRTYEKMYGENFARAALSKSNNLVGETIAHILNGVINKAARDAVLLQHAIKDIAEKNKDDALRYELLISRLVRIHWDRQHLMRVKKEYYAKYRITLEDAIEEATKGDFREFMCELCETK